jgi:hypothetical protein
MITFTKDVEIEVVEEFDDANEKPTIKQELFRAGEKVDADVITEPVEGRVDLQFGDGSVALGIDTTLFTVV